MSLHCRSLNSRSRIRLGIFRRNIFPYFVTHRPKSSGCYVYFHSSIFYGTVLSQCSKNHFPPLFFHHIPLGFNHCFTQNLEHATFYSCATCLHVHSSSSRRYSLFFLFRLLFNFSISKAFYSILTSILFSLVFLIVGLQRKPGTGYHVMGNIDNVIGLLGAQACQL